MKKNREIMESRPQSPVIKVSNLSKDYFFSKRNPGFRGGFRHFFLREKTVFSAVREISFELFKGEIVGFIGPNGAGKTTTLKMLCGLLYPSSGKITVNGHSPYLRKKQFLSEITLVMGQKQQLIWDLPPMDSFMVNAAIYGLNEFESKRRIDELANMLYLGEELYKPVRKLSLGQRMKAELLASLIHRPSFLFLDEPTLGLDINSQIRVREFLRDYNKKYGSTILLTSHYMADISSLCKRIIIIQNGKLNYDGDLNSLNQELNPYKSLTVQSSEIIPYKLLEDYGEIVTYSEFSFTLLVERSELPRVLTSILNNYAINDVDVSEPPIEKSIANLFNSIPSIATIKCSSKL